MKHTDKHRKGVSNIEDYRHEDGSWSKGFTETTETEYIFYYTRAGKLWNVVNNRCSGKKNFLERMPCYSGVTNGFDDFQSFTDWCHTQGGYFQKESTGMFWQIDKDILYPGNKTYSQSTCCFVPGYVNSVLLTKRKEEKELPIGVKQCPRTGKWISRILTKHLGLFPTIEEASAAWATAKSGIIESVIQTYSEHEASRVDVCDALMLRVSHLKRCAEKGLPVYKLG